MNQYSDYELLEGVFKSLITKDETERNNAVLSLKSHVESAFREMSTERFGNFENDLYQVSYSKKEFRPF
jgi:hypothetical protein